MPILRLDRLDDPRLADYQDIKDAARIRGRGVFLLEGLLIVQAALARGRHPPRSLLVSDKRLPRLEAALRAWPELPVYVLDSARLNELVGFSLHRGCLGAVPVPAPLDPLALARPPGPRRLLILEATANHDNVGAAFRNAAAFGVDALLLDPRAADPLYRKAVRTSMGAVLTVPWARFERWPDPLLRLRELGYTIAALSPQGAQPIGQLLTDGAPSRVALLVGTEGAGLDPQTLALADARWRIDIQPTVDSLNAATAAAVALHTLQLAQPPPTDA